MKSAIKYDAWQKLQNAPLRDFDPLRLVEAKYTTGSGYLLELERLYSTMFHEWATLQKDVSDTMEAVSALDWSVAPYVEGGRKPEKRAVEVAETVSRAIWHGGAQEAGTFAHGFLELVGSMLDGLYRGVNVHEVVWGRDAKLVFPVEYRQVPAQFYMWETREGERDRLLLVRDGMSYERAEVFPADRFVIAMNVTGSDHPIYNAVYYSLLGYFVAAKYGLPWMQEYCKRYGHPVRKFRCETEAAAAALRAQVEATPDVSDVFLVGVDADMEVTPVPAGASIPHEALLRVAENACHQAILGQTLTSDTSVNGGSRAQAEVHLGVQKSVVMKRAEFVARVLNRQLIPAIVRMNFGRVEGVPMPELKFALPDDGANVERADYWARVLALPGVTVAREVVYESLRIPMPGEGEETLGSTKEDLRSTNDDLRFKKDARPGGAGKGKEEGADDDDDDPEPPKGSRKLEVGSRKSDNGGDAAKAGHCNQHGHVPGCDGGGEGVSLANDTTGLQAHLNDVVEPVEVNFEPVSVNLKQLLREGKTEEYNRARKMWREEFKAFYQEQLAGQSIEIKGSGYSMYFPESGKANRLAAKGIRNQARAEAGMKMKEAVENSYHLHQGLPEHKGGESELRRKMVDKADAFHVFGCPVSINGERTLMWMAATHRKDEKSPKQLVFYEFGVAESKKKAGGESLVQKPNFHRTDSPPARATLLDVLRDVKSDFEGKPKITGEDIKSSRRPLLRQAQMVPTAAQETYATGGAPVAGGYVTPGVISAESGGNTEGIVSGGRADVKQNDEVERLAVEAGREWTAPLRRQVARWLVEGVPLAELRGRVHELRPDTQALAGGLHRAFAAGLRGESAEAANPGGCNQYGHAPGCKHGSGGWSSGSGGSGKAPEGAEDDGKEPWERRQEERERLEALLSELEWEEEAARDAEAAGDERFFSQEKADERWDAIYRAGDPTTRAGIERRLAELDALDAAEEAKGANPYGCNQYGEGWSEPHDGNSTSYQQMGPGKPERKTLTHESGGNKVEQVTHEKHPGKGAYPDATPEGLDKVAKEQREKVRKPSVGVEVFAGKLEKAVDKATADLFREQMANAPAEARALFEKYKGEIEISSKSKGVSCCWSGIPPTVELNKQHNALDNKWCVPNGYLLHELGHALDAHAGEGKLINSPLSSKLKESIDADVNEVFDRTRKELETEKGRKVRKDEIRSHLVSELNTLDAGLVAVTDAYGAKGIFAAIKHSPSYFKKKPYAGRTETFANLYEAHVLQDKKMIDAAKKYLPRTYDRFIDILKEHTKGE